MARARSKTQAHASVLARASRFAAAQKRPKWHHVCASTRTVLLLLCLKLG
jgi:hypothetical protein